MFILRKNIFESKIALHEKSYQNFLNLAPSSIESIHSIRKRINEMQMDKSTLSVSKDVSYILRIKIISLIFSEIINKIDSLFSHQKTGILSS